MGTRRSHSGRTAAVLPRGTRRPRPASTLLLSFALLVAIGSASAQGLTGRPASLNGSRPSKTSSAACTTVAAAHDLATDIATLSPTSTATIVGVSHCPHLMPPPHPPGMRPKRASAAANQDDASVSALVALAASAPDSDSGIVVSTRIFEGASTAFIAHASRSSRTRGQPAADC